MPVGAGSIKRAAKAAGTAKKGKAAELLEMAEKPIEETEGGKADESGTLEAEAIVAGAEVVLKEETVKDVPQTVPAGKKVKSKTSGEKSEKKSEKKLEKKSGKKSKKEIIGKGETEGEVIEKKPMAKETEKRDGKKPVAKKAAKKAVTEKAEKKKTAKKEAGIAQATGKSAGQYEAYGIGQPLPVHLL